MPDHVHLLMVFNPQVEMSKSIGCWKSYCAREIGFIWQRGYFDHRIRNATGLLEKAEYLVSNPVRAGLIERADDWAYSYKGTDLRQ